MTGLLKITDPFFLLLLPITAAASHRSGYGPVYPIVKQISNDSRWSSSRPKSPSSRSVARARTLTSTN